MGIYPSHEWPDCEKLVYEPTTYLLGILEKYNIKAIFYCVGLIANMYPQLIFSIRKRGHKIGSHGYWHDHNEREGDISDYKTRQALPDAVEYRSPFWDTTPMPSPPSGGFFFRAMPFWYAKWAVKESGQMWLHPHDLLLEHPKLENRFLNWKRHVGLKGARRKLERLFQEVEFADPSQN